MSSYIAAGFNGSHTRPGVVVYNHQVCHARLGLISNAVLLVPGITLHLCCAKDSPRFPRSRLLSFWILCICKVWSTTLRHFYTVPSVTITYIRLLIKLIIFDNEPQSTTTQIQKTKTTVVRSLFDPGSLGIEFINFPNFVMSWCCWTSPGENMQGMVKNIQSI